MSNENAEKLSALKQKADAMGITYHPSIGADSLAKKIAEADEQPVKAVAKPKVAKKPRPATKAEIANFKRKRANRLHRVQLTCMNPAKKDIAGEIFSVGNRLIGTIKKYISFGVPVHVPEIILNEIENRQYIQHYSTVDSRGHKIKKARWVKEFAVMKLEPLTEEELRQIAVAQARTQDAA